MSRYHFIGINGIGMSSLAHILLQKEQQVSGSDAKVGANAQFLQKKGARVFEGHASEYANGADCVVYSSAIKEDNVEFVSAKAKGSTLYHRSDLLQELTVGYEAIMVAGTHGKTTTSAIIAHLMQECGLDPSYVIGGVTKTLPTHGKLGKGPYFIVEADESDGSFLKTRAKYAIVTNIEADHLDYWETFEKLEHAFLEFRQQCEGKFFYHESCNFTSGISYGESDSCDVQLIDCGEYFDVRIGSHLYENFTTRLMGKHNLLNATAAIALLIHLGADFEKVRASLKTFESVARRLEFVNHCNGIDFYDDYAHHPTEILASYNALKSVAKGRRIIPVVQPHRFSRVKSFLNEFRSVFGQMENLVLLPIYSAGETEEPLLFEALTDGFEVIKRDELGSKLKEGDIVLTMGAGDVTQIGRNYV